MKNNIVQQIADVLIGSFDDIYCYNCKFEGSDDPCEYCHRKSMIWEISPTFANAIANRIYTLFSNVQVYNELLGWLHQKETEYNGAEHWAIQQVIEYVNNKLDNKE